MFADFAGKALFAGDHVLPTITPSIGFEPEPTPLPLGDFLTSLIRVRSLPDALLLPAHGPVPPSSHARIDGLLRHHDERLALCRAQVTEAGVTAYDVALALPWTRHERQLNEMDAFNAGLAVLETRAHLELLVHEGDLTLRSVEGVALYLRSSTTNVGPTAGVRHCTPSATSDFALWETDSR